MTEKCIKLLRLALDKAAHEGEIDNAAVMFVRACRARGETVESITGPNNAGGVRVWRFTFGKHKGCALEEIDTDYLEWALETLERISPSFRRAIHAEIVRRGSE